MSKDVEIWTQLHHDWSPSLFGRFEAGDATHCHIKESNRSAKLGERMKGTQSGSLRGMDTYRLSALRCEFAKNSITRFPLWPCRTRRFWLMHSSPRPLDLASAIPPINMSLEQSMSSWNCKQSSGCQHGAFFAERGKPGLIAYLPNSQTYTKAGS